MIYSSFFEFDFYFWIYFYKALSAFYSLVKWKEEPNEDPNFIKLFLISIYLLFYIGKFLGI